MAISQLLGFSEYPIKSIVNDHLGVLKLDSAQKNVIANAAQNSLVIQGPPGTGKSHTITALIQYYIRQNKTVLFVSEKKSALDVVYNRMGALKHLMAYFDADQQPKKKVL